MSQKPPSQLTAPSTDGIPHEGLPFAWLAVPDSRDRAGDGYRRYPFGLTAMLFSGGMFRVREHVQAKLDMFIAAHQERVRVFQANLTRACREREAQS